MRPRTLRHAVIASGARWIVSIIFMGLVFPVMIHRLGVRSFGLWAALTAPTSMMGLVGFGVGPAMVALIGRSVGTARAAETDDECDRALSYAGGLIVAGLVMSALAAIVAVGLGVWIAPAMARLLHVPPSQMAGAIRLFRASSFGLACLLIGACYSSQIEAVGRVDLSVFGYGIVSVANSAFLLVAILLSATFDALALVVVATGIMSVVLPVALCFRSRASVLVAWYRFDRSATKAMLRLAPGLGGANAISATFDPMIKWSVGSALGPLPVSAYELSTRVVSVVSGVFTSLLYPIMPHSAVDVGRGERAGLTSTVKTAVRRVTVLGFPTLVAVAAGCGPLLALWLGSGVPGGTATSIRIVCVGAALSMATLPAYQALQGSGHGNRVLSVQATTLAGIAFVVAILVPAGVKPAYVGALAFSFGVLLATPVADAQYGVVFGKAALWGALRATLAGIAPGLVVLPWVFVVRALGGGAWAQLGALGLAWAATVTAVARLGILGDMGKITSWRRGAVDT
jgi:O-antigen/teichoic acid export membrane protein